MARTVWTSIGAYHETPLSRTIWSAAGAIAIKAAAGGPVSGEVSQTLGAVTLAASGTLPISGALAQTLGAVTSSSAGGVSNTGALDATLGAVAIVATGRAVVGRLDVTLGPVAIVATGSVRAATLSVTLGAVTLAATGTHAIAGLLAKTLGAVTLAASGTLPIVGTLGAQLGAVTSAATDTPKTFFFAWTDAGIPFSSAMLREDEQIFALDISHEEGNFPALQIDVVNPRVGLLAAGRNLWCWLSWNNAGDIVRLFNGRVIGIPENLHDEVVRLLFVARPEDYQTQKAALAESLKVRPYWDPVWIADGDNDPDTVLEARSQIWHIDRTTLEVSVSDMLVGESGVVVVSAGNHFYDGMEVSFSDAPLRRVLVNATVAWEQSGSGTVDLTRQMHQKFVDEGSPFAYPMISSFTGDGLFTSWPEPGANIGGGWGVGALASIEEAPWAGAPLLLKSYLKPHFETLTFVNRPGSWGTGRGGGAGYVWQPAITQEGEVFDSWEQWSVVFPLNAYAINFSVTWTAARSRTENISFVLEADVQNLLVEPGDAEEHEINLSSAFVSDLIDGNAGSPMDMTMPIGDLRNNAYFRTDRGAQSAEFLLMLARAILRKRARAVNIKIEVPWHIAVGLSCRHSVQVVDSRLPGGFAAGKVIGYSLIASGEGDMHAVITIGCSVGHDGTLAPVEGTPTYADDYADNYDIRAGRVIVPDTEDVTYESMEDFVIDDDGIDLFQMTPARVLNSITIQGGPIDQQITLNIFPENAEAPVMGYTWSWNNYVEQDPSAVLEQDPTIVTVDLAPISGRSFETNYEMIVSKLKIPKTVDTEVA